MPRYRTSRRPRWLLLAGVAALAAVLLASSLLAEVVPTSPSLHPGGPPTAAPAATGWSVEELRSAPLAVTPDTEPGFQVPKAVDHGAASVPSLLILVSFPTQHAAELAQFLAALSEPSSPVYHEYLSAAAFDSEYGGSPTLYASAIAYFQSFGVNALQTFADRLTLTFQASPAQIEQMFHATIDQFSVGGSTYLAPTELPELPAPLASAGLSVEGLSTYSTVLIHPDSLAALVRASPASAIAATGSAASYLAPVMIGGVQDQYAPDFQVAYDEAALFTGSGYPTNEVIATILWSGYDNSHTDVGPFVPSDIYSFFNETLPVGEPHAQVYGVPLSGAPPPGPSASTDVSGANFENTLDLEMAGSTAPGASIYNVYGPTATSANLDAALSYILNPTHTPGLANVNVISNSWGGTDGNDSAWYADLQEAQARGISVLASSGDSADNPSSSKWIGSNAEFPSSMAYDTFGMTAVGGTTVLMNSNLQLQSQVTWNDSASRVGSSGGISASFPEPSWQSDTSASSVIGGQGRGVPDIAGVANNTLITISVDGIQYRATNATYGGGFYSLGGTSVASPLDAGIVAEIDHVLAANSLGNLGFLDPQLYSLANREFTPPHLPTVPLVDVTSGRNYVYAARTGYDLVTGWGSIDAYNCTEYLIAPPATYSVTFTESGMPTGAGGGISFNGGGLMAFTSGGTLTFSGLVDGNYPYTVTTAAGYALVSSSPSSPVTVNGADVAVTEVFEARYTVTFVEGGIPNSGTWSVSLNGNSSGTLPGTTTSTTFQIGNGTFNYAWGDTSGYHITTGTYSGALTVSGSNPSPVSVTFTRVLYAVTVAETGLPTGAAWWLNLTSGPSLGPTTTTTMALSEPNGSYPYTIATVDKQYAAAGGTFAVSGSSVTENVTFSLVTYRVTFRESGLTGETWGITLNGTPLTATSPTSITFSEPNGTYRYTVSNVPGWRTGSYSGSVTVDGSAPGAVTVAFTQVTYSVTFSESGLPSGTWTVTLNGTTHTEPVLTSIVASLPNGTFTYAISDYAGYHQLTLPYDGTGSIQGAAVTEATLLFTEVTYSVTFTEAGLLSGTSWSVTVNDVPQTVTTSTIAFSETNGSYPFSVGTVPGYTASVASGTVPVSGAAVNVPTITFTPVVGEYSVEFHESGLPNGTLWSVTLGILPESSTTTTIIFTGQMNGIYAYSIGDVPGWHQTTLPYTGTVEVSGSTVTESTLEFSQALYPVTFTETGLPTGTAWWVNLTSGPSFGPNTATMIAFSEPNGSYAYTVATVDKEYASAGGTFAVSGSSVTESVTFSLVTYSVTFSESGLTGETWGITLNGTPLTATAPASITFTEPNGTYSYTVSNVPGWRTGSYSGSVTVNGAAPRTVTVAFTQVTYKVEFTVSGLTGETWTVTFNGTSSGPQTGTSFAFQSPNGTYPWTFAAVPGWHILVGAYSGTSSVSGGTHAVDGSYIAVTVATTFTQVTYKVEFTVSGLTGEAWAVTFNGTSSGPQTGTGFAFQSPNGTYPWTIVAVPGWHISIGAYSGTSSISGGTHAIDGSYTAVTVATTFTQVTYSVTFSESGLPSGTWTVTVNGTAYTEPVATSIVAALPNGTLTYAISDYAGYHQLTLAYHGTGNIEGAAVAEPTLLFTQVTYSVTFAETGMPAAAGGGVTFNGGGMTPFSAGGTLTFTEPNGTYRIAISPGTGYQLVSPTPSSSVAVSGLGVTVTVLFEAIYSVTFTETGMPTAVGGGVAFNGGEVTPFSPDGTLTFSALVNGSYSYTISAGAGYQLVSSTPGSPVTVSGSDLTVTGVFEAVYTVTFTQTGIPNGTEWMIQVTLTADAPVPAGSGGVGMSWFANSTGPTAVFLLTNGTYSYLITASGYQTTAGTLPVNGQAESVLVAISANSSSSGLPFWVYVVIGVAIAGVFVGVAIGVMRHRRPPPVAAWSSPPTPPSDPGSGGSS